MKKYYRVLTSLSALLLVFGVATAGEPELNQEQLLSLFHDPDRELRRAAGLYEMVLEDLAGLHLAAGRFGEGRDVAGVVRFLLSPEAAYITGQTLVVDGGMIA